MSIEHLSPNLDRVRVQDLDAGHWAFLPQRAENRSEHLILTLCLRQPEDETHTTILFINGVRPGLHRVALDDAAALAVRGEVSIKYAVESLTRAHGDDADWTIVRFTLLGEGPGFLATQYVGRIETPMAVELNSLAVTDAEPHCFWTRQYSVRWKPDHEREYVRLASIG